MRILYGLWFTLLAACLIQAFLGFEANTGTVVQRLTTSWGPWQFGVLFLLVSVVLGCLRRAKRR